MCTALGAALRGQRFRGRQEPLVRVGPRPVDHARVARSARAVEPVQRAPYARGGGTRADAVAAHLLEELHALCVELDGGEAAAGCGGHCRLLTNHRGEPLRGDAVHLVEEHAASIAMRGLSLLG